jgi:DNA-binding HxlR family transcriptional regulator
MSTRPGASEIPPCGCSIPGEAEPGVCYCSVEDLLRVVRRRYSLSVLNAVHTRGAARFHDLEAALDGISTSTLTETLNALLSARLLVRAATEEGSHRAPYSITPAGEKLLSRLRRLLDEVRGD